MELERLTEYRDRREYIAALREELEQLRDMREHVPLKCDLQTLVVKICALEEEIAYELTELVEIERNVRNLISTLDDPTEKAVLTRRYILCETWGAMSLAMHYSQRTLMQYRVKAIKHLAEKECS